jgi:hypothetical protein
MQEERVTSISTRGDELRELGGLGFSRDGMAEEIRGELRIRQLEKGGECTLLRVGCGTVAGTQESLEQYVELFQPAAAAPADTTFRRGVQYWRSTSIFLISAIALAGFRSFGHTSVQFMIVWQR